MAVKAKELDYETMRCLLWLLLNRNGGSVTITKKEIDEMPLVGTIYVDDTNDQVIVKAKIG